MYFRQFWAAKHLIIENELTIMHTTRKYKDMLQKMYFTKDVQSNKIA